VDGRRDHHGRTMDEAGARSVTRETILMRNQP
jgi:hypothetical protein